MALRSLTCIQCVQAKSHFFAPLLYFILIVQLGRVKGYYRSESYCWIDYTNGVENPGSMENRVRKYCVKASEVFSVGIGGLVGGRQPTSTRGRSKRRGQAVAGVRSNLIACRFIVDEHRQRQHGVDENVLMFISSGQNARMLFFPPVLALLYIGV